MKALALVAKVDLKQSLRSKWFLVYALVFAGLVALIFATGVTSSRVQGFTGLTRLLLIFIQACNIILPIFILITTVRSIVGEREAHVFEYMLSFPLSLKAFYWGKFIGRLVAVIIPLAFAMALAVIIGLITGGVPWGLTFVYCGLLFCSAVCFLGIGFFISCVSRSIEMATAAAFIVWFVLIALIDLVLIGIMIKSRVAPEAIFMIALTNPVQLFRIAAISLFDPVLSVIGPAAYYILDRVSRNVFLLYAFLYNIAVGLIFVFAGYKIFSRKDLL